VVKHDICEEAIADLIARLTVPIWNGNCLQQKEFLSLVVPL